VQSSEQVGGSDGVADGDFQIFDVDEPPQVGAPKSTTAATELHGKTRKRAGKRGREHNNRDPSRRRAS
jgi:hypothetical protein